MLPMAAGDEQLAQETVAQILSHASTAAATHIMLPLPPGQSQVGYFFSSVIQDIANKSTFGSVAIFRVNIISRIN